jgi:hypothetical protein
LFFNPGYTRNGTRTPNVQTALHAALRPEEHGVHAQGGEVLQEVHEHKYILVALFSTDGEQKKDG